MAKVERRGSLQTCFSFTDRSAVLSATSFAQCRKLSESTPGFLCASPHRRYAARSGHRSSSHRSARLNQTEGQSSFFENELMQPDLASCASHRYNCYSACAHKFRDAILWLAASGHESYYATISSYFFALSFAGLVQILLTLTADLGVLDDELYFRNMLY